MEPLALSQWLTFIANVAVVGGIFFLAVEVRQNSRNMAAQVRATFFVSVADTFRIPAENHDLTQIMERDMKNESLAQAETWQVQAFWTRIHLAMEWGYKELPPAEFANGLSFQKLTHDMFPAYRSAWEQREDLFDRQFYRYMCDNVFTSEDEAHQ